MNIEPFAMERWQSTHEHSVEINLSDSGVHPMTVRELVQDPTRLDELLDIRLIYTQTNGTPELRDRIAALYPGASRDEVGVVNGGAEANFIATWSFVEPGDEVVFMLPNYMQIHGAARSLGAEVVPWELQPDLDAGRWNVDIDRLESIVGPRTRMIAICNPNNPTGARLDGAELDRICDIAARHGSWILSDEIYQGAELDGVESPTIWGRYDRVLITNSLSKAYGFPGLRLGWVVGPSDRIADLWMRHDYTTIGPSALSDALALEVLAPATRRRVLERTRDHLATNYATVAGWLADTPGLRHIPPRAGAMLYLRYEHDLNSTEIAERLRTEKSVLLVPGDHFGMDRWLRIGFGGETEHIETGLSRLAELLAAP